MELLRSDATEYVFDVFDDEDGVVLSKLYFDHGNLLRINRAEARSLMHALEDYFHGIDAAG